MRTLLLVGGGHSHSLLLRRLRGRLDANTQVILVSPERFAPYSAMLPGLVAGHFRFRDCHIDLGKLCENVGAELVCGRVENLDLESREALLNNGQRLSFDYISINCGIQSTSPPPGASEHNCLSVKPISQFLPQWQETLERLYSRHDRHKGANLAVVGCGATGVELAMAIRYRLDHDPRIKVPVDIHLVHSGGTLLAEAQLEAQLHVARQLQEMRIRAHPLFTVTRVAEQELFTERGQHLPVDEIVWCLQGSAPAWPGQCGLTCDSAGLIKVNAHLQSESHPFVFAAGDIASVSGQPLPRAGVYAVRQARVLADNLIRTLHEEPGSADRGKLRVFRAQKNFLSIITCGDQYAIAQRGRWVMAGKWVWRWKRFIDQRFMAQFPHP
ncbi:FAD-dependent oxidoreductase [Marinimicrobium sp. ABcell2]|uniref:FAD-dependent oxidoreductase n=1 Tax=Marinimicrobium sp. ABcell2 TaxID=3069751 RepID=UPI0027B2E2C6|nr:FAD-dependent oxidoreductase [Marinimicrobium sp. ABcell2]MDQ2076499.1 FAD-dependent oxidoreductase [Marinimicrobium sp. ABcell2]